MQLHFLHSLSASVLLILLLCRVPSRLSCHLTTAQQSLSITITCLPQLISLNTIWEHEIILFKISDTGKRSFSMELTFSASESDTITKRSSIVTKCKHIQTKTTSMSPSWRMWMVAIQTKFEQSTTLSFRLPMIVLCSTVRNLSV